MSISDRIHVVDHPLVQHHLARLRDVSTTPVEFRAIVRRLAMLLAGPATAGLATKDLTVTTPLKQTVGRQLSQRIGLVPILRAGLGLVDPLLDLIPTAEVWHLGIYRDEATAEPVEYYQKLPKSNPVDVAIVLDPMLATGGSAVAAIEVLRRWSVPHIKVISLISAPEGLALVTKHDPEVEIFVGSIDECLNDRKFIVPGLGDAGDRQFNTICQ